MRRRNLIGLIFSIFMMLIQACVMERRDIDAYVQEVSQFSSVQQELKSSDFKLPLSSDYKWGVSQSWGEHCEECDQKYPADPNNAADKSFCESSHAGTYTYYGWDFNLPGTTDKGKPVLAVADGSVKTVYEKTVGAWGNYVVIDHGNNLCTRYAHLLEKSITVEQGQQICQGLKVAEVGDSGDISGPHLHFQFEECDSKKPVVKGFGLDGSYIPKCLIGDSDIKANPLQYYNLEKGTCGWVDVGCGNISGCPLKTCGNKGQPPFSDMASLDSRTSTAVKYLWRECAIGGKNDGKFHPEDGMTRAETLKIAFELFGPTSCGGTEPFNDVKPKDWFYPYVVCAVKHGIVETKYSGFLPNWTISFSEAAKILVLVASKAGKIEIKSPKKGHFAKLWNNHWAYNYIETIFFYGGVNFSLPEKDPASSMKRGEFAVMAAALSPCFCESVKCGPDCACNQESYSCNKVVVAEKPLGGGQYAGEGSSGTGSSSGSGSGGSGSSGSSGNSGSTNCKPKTCYELGYNCGSYADGCGGTLNCGSCSTGNICENGKCLAICKPKTCYELGYSCGSYADGCGGTFNCGSCSTGSNCENGKCVASCKPKTCAEVGRECDYYIDPNPCPGVSAPYCGSCPSGSYCDNGKCVVACKPKTCADPGYNCGSFSNGCGEKLECDSCPSGYTCNKPLSQCALKNSTWKCDPAKGYKLRFLMPQGIFEKWSSSHTSPSKYDTEVLGFDIYGIDYGCKDLPSVVRLSPADASVKVWTEEVGLPTDLPNFSIWINNSGELTINPPTPPDFLTNSFQAVSLKGALLIRIPGSQ